MRPLAFIFAFIKFINCEESLSVCTTPTGDRGECISIMQCDSLLELLNKKDRTIQDVDTLRRSQCGFQRDVPQVCCPSQCFTIEGELGTCIGITSCPHLVALLKPPITTELTSYIQSSRCEGPDRYSVCCGQNVIVRSGALTEACAVTIAVPEPRAKCCGLDNSEQMKAYMCTTPTGARGECISIMECDQLQELLNKKDKTNQDVDTLRRSQCGFRRGVPQVCCPTQCFTIEGDLGTCIGITSCPHFVALLKQLITPELTSYIQNSRCEGPDNHSVCCSQNVSIALPDPKTKCCGLNSSEQNKGSSPPGQVKVDWQPSENPRVPSTTSERPLEVIDIRVTGGNITDVDQYPWLTVIEYRKDNRTRLLCGGGLISAKYVLTAGHCVVGSILRYGTPANVRLGDYNTVNEGKDCKETMGIWLECNDGAVVIPIERSIPHPQYDPHSTLRRHDIALLRLTKLAVYTDFIRPICLPNSDLTLNPPSDLMLFAAGWGAVDDMTPSSELKLHVALPYYYLESCQPAYMGPKRNITLWNRQLCAGGVIGEDSCQGDSGGPLMYMNKNRQWEVTGIISFGPIPCGTENVPGVYTNVFHYIPWIRSQIRP